MRYSSDLQITGRYVNVNVSAAWQKQKRDNIITMDATVLRQVNGVVVKDAVINAKYTNKTTEVRLPKSVFRRCQTVQIILLRIWPSIYCVTEDILRIWESVLFHTVVSPYEPES